LRKVGRTESIEDWGWSRTSQEVKTCRNDQCGWTIQFKAGCKSKRGGYCGLQRIEADRTPIKSRILMVLSRLGGKCVL
jgi:hypothetical protein